MIPTKNERQRYSSVRNSRNKGRGCGVGVCRGVGCGRAVGVGVIAGVDVGVDVGVPDGAGVGVGVERICTYLIVAKS
jgi:hypothetical protein